MTTATDHQRMEKIVSLCKRRGFIFQAAEIYGGLNGVWDFGPLGVELKRNLKDYWWRVMVRERDDVVGLDGSILTHRAVLKASGHEDTFSDPMSTCKHCKRLQRADQIWPQIEQSDWYDALAEMFALGRLDTPNLQRWAETKGRRDAPNLAIVRNFPVTLSWLSERLERTGGGAELPMREFVQHLATEQFNQTGLVTPCPHCGGELTEPRPFNLMFRTNMGASGDDETSIAYLRPETAQSIFVQFKNVLDTARKKLPFGIAQIGKAFRNEINPRNYIFRSREFEQMELEYFCAPEDGMRLLDYWLEERLRFYENIGIPRAKLHVLTVPDADRAFYSKGTYDIEYEFPFGVQELEGVAYRTDYDLTQHQNASGKPLEYFDEETKAKFVPHVVEPSAGVDRTVLALICEAFAEETVTDEKGKSETRTVMRFHPRIAPVKVGVFPLLKNKPDLVAKAREVHALLKPHMMTFYDEAGAIGRRYRRQDEAGTPFGLTIDFETLGERGDELRDTVTLRHRDSMQQERVKIADLLGKLLPQVM
ncbi:MAG: glycine--tRNA ligase [Chthoniobacterales bacterium]|nr:glycine--tRNA ligase [Chthoniobacterales bacterium]